MADQGTKDGRVRDQAWMVRVVRTGKILTCHKPLEDFNLKVKEATEGSLAEKNGLGHIYA